MTDRYEIQHTTPDGASTMSTAGDFKAVVSQVDTTDLACWEADPVKGVQTATRRDGSKVTIRRKR